MLYDIVYGNKAYHKKEQTLQDYWHSHHNLPIDNCDDVDWEVSRLATKRLSIGKQRWIVEFWSGHHGVGHMMKHHGKQESSRCPACGASNEKTSHLLQYSNPEARKLIQIKYKDELELVLTKHKTDPCLL